MTLLEFISTLGTQNVNVKIFDGDTEKIIIEFKSQGYAGVEGDILAKNVASWTVNSVVGNSSSITITLEKTDN